MKLNIFKNKSEASKFFKSEKKKKTAKLHRHSKILIIDGLNLFLRNFAMLNFVNEDGVHIGGLGGFLRSLGALIRLIQPTSAYVVFDGAGASLNRRNLLPEYKEGRGNNRITNFDIFENLEEEHDAKVDQIVRLAQYLKCLPVKTVAIDKVEADDVISFIAKRMAKQYKSKVTIVSADRDFLQLASPNISIYRPIEKKFYNDQTVLEKFNVLAKNFTIYKTLLGDKSDGIRGISGLGEIKFKKLFSHLGKYEMDLDHLIETCGNKIKDNPIYGRVISEQNRLRDTYKLMDLHNPLLGEDDKEYLEALIESSTFKLNSKLFLGLYKEDSLRHTIRNVEFWITDNFRTLQSYNK
tara:strand:+ start:2669 stop:3724 length:1056 start_codon:yes stop_codon:yes gene_type:complete